MFHGLIFSLGFTYLRSYARGVIAFDICCVRPIFDLVRRKETRIYRPLVVQR